MASQELGVDCFGSLSAEAAMSQESGDHLKVYAIAQMQRAIACLGWRGSRAHAGVHQARKSLRRTRACLALGESSLGAGAGTIDRELSNVCDSLSDLRDAKARVESLDRLLRGNAESEVHSCLMSAKRLAIKARTEAMRKEQAGDPHFLTRCERLQVLLAAMPVLPWNHINASALTYAMQQTLQVCDQAAETALKRGREKDWHRLRRRRRRMAQQHTAIEQCAMALPQPQIPDRKLGELLGQAQDLSVLQEFFRKHEELSPEKRQQLRGFLKDEFKHMSAEAMASG